VPWRYFTRDEFRCHCGCAQNKVQDELIDRLDLLRGTVGHPLRISSGYRCPFHNCQVSKTGQTGPHTTGYAADLALERGQAYRVLREALILGFTGIGINQKGTGRFLHLDLLPNLLLHPRPTVWSY